MGNCFGACCGEVDLEAHQDRLDRAVKAERERERMKRGAEHRKNSDRRRSSSSSRRRKSSSGGARKESLQIQVSPQDLTQTPSQISNRSRRSSRAEKRHRRKSSNDTGNLPPLITDIPKIEAFENRRHTIAVPMFEMTIENPSDENLQTDEPLKPQTSTTDPLKISARDKEKSKTRMSLSTYEANLLLQQLSQNNLGEDLSKHNSSLSRQSSGRGSKLSLKSQLSNVSRKSSNIGQGGKKSTFASNGRSGKRRSTLTRSTKFFGKM
jgi:hypothetical protein